VVRCLTLVLNFASTAFAATWASHSLTKWREHPGSNSTFLVIKSLRASFNPVSTTEFGNLVNRTDVEVLGLE